MATSCLGRPGSPCQPLYSLMAPSIPSLVPISLTTMRVSYCSALRPCHNVRKKTNLFVPTYLLIRTELKRLQASGGSRTTWTFPAVVVSLLRATLASALVPPGGTLTLHRRKQHRRSLVYQMASYLDVVVECYLPASHHVIIVHRLVPRMRPHAGLRTRGIGAVLDSHLQTTIAIAGHLNMLAYVNRLRPFGTHS